MPDRALIVVTRVAQRGEWLQDELTGPPLPPVPSEEWLAGRAEYLERVTVAFLRHVTTPFSWVWRVCPERRDQAQELADRLWPEAVLLDDELTSDAVAPDAESFVGLRLDADDAFFPECIDALSGIDLPPNALINWRGGYKLNWQTGSVIPWEWPKRRQGPFLAVTLDGRERMLDVPGPHNPARQGRDHVIHVEERAWVQTIHGENITSKWRTGAWGDTQPLSDEDAAAVLARAHIER